MLSCQNAHITSRAVAGILQAVGFMPLLFKRSTYALQPAAANSACRTSFSALDMFQGSVISLDCKLTMASEAICSAFLGGESRQHKSDFFRLCARQGCASCNCTATICTGISKPIPGDSQLSLEHVQASIDGFVDEHKVLHHHLLLLIFQARRWSCLTSGGRMLPTGRCECIFLHMTLQGPNSLFLLSGQARHICRHASPA